MSEALYRYYERELAFLRQTSQEFAKAYPATANRLFLDPNVIRDPHTERLMQAFALLTARIQHKLDDEFPELTEGLLSILYPHYLAPIPSMAILQFTLDAQLAKLPGGFRLERDSKLETTPVSGVPCQFRTCYPTTLWPVEVTDARLQPPPFPGHLQPPRALSPTPSALLRIQLRSLGGLRFADLQLERLRLYLYGDAQVVPPLYELMLNNALLVAVRGTNPGKPPTVLQLKPRDCLFPVGFDRDQSILPYPPHAFPAYRLLTELFTFPAKFHFLDLGGWAEVAAAGFGDQAEVVIYLDRTDTVLEQQVNAATFRPGCTPAVNLFKTPARPIKLTHTKPDYLVVPDDADHRHGMEIYSIDSVVEMDETSAREYQPFYSLHHARDPGKQQAFWYGSRRPSTVADDRGTDVYLHVVDLAFQPDLPAEATLIPEITCTNRDLPVKLPQTGEEVTFSLLQAAPLAGPPRCLSGPTPPLRPPHRRALYWRLLSHLALNHLSITDPQTGRAALQEMLRLYDFADAQTGQQLAAVNRQLIEGIQSVRSRPIVGYVADPSAPDAGFCRGTEITLELDETKYVGTGAFLFAAVLDRFFGTYASINSFTQLVAKLRQREGVLKTWPPRSGEMPLL